MCLRESGEVICEVCECRSRHSVLAYPRIWGMRVYVAMVDSGNVSGGLEFRFGEMKFVCGDLVGGYCCQFW